MEKESWNWSSNPDVLCVTKKKILKRIYQKPRVDYEKNIQNSLELKYACYNIRKFSMDLWNIKQK